MQTDPIGYSAGINWYLYCGNNPIVFIDPSGTNVFGGYVSWRAGYGFDTSYDMGWSEAGQLSLAAIEGSGKGAAATADGFIPFADPFKGSYAGPGGNVEGVYKFSQAMGRVARDAWLAAAIPNIGAWAEHPVLYEAGSMTYSNARYAELGLEGLSAVDKGRRILEAGYTVGGALTPSITTAYATTITTGLTPGCYLLGIGALETADSWHSRSVSQSTSQSSYSFHGGSIGRK